MRTLLRALFVGAVATAGFAALVTALAPDTLRRPTPADDGDDYGPDDEIDADEMTDAEAFALLRELARDLDLSDLDDED